VKNYIILIYCFDLLFWSCFGLHQNISKGHQNREDACVSL